MTDDTKIAIREQVIVRAAWNIWRGRNSSRRRTALNQRYIDNEYIEHAGAKYDIVAVVRKERSGVWLVWLQDYTFREVGWAPVQQFPDLDTAIVAVEMEWTP